MLKKTAKISVIGAGSVGSAVAYALVLLRRCERVVLYDRTLARAEGEAWDIADAIPMLSEMDVIPTDLFEDVCDSEVVVVTAGAKMKEGETRLQLLERNAVVLSALMVELDRVSPESVVIIVSNPVDVVARIALAASTRSPALIFGAGTVLDTSRLQYRLGKLLGIDDGDVSVSVIGEHGDSEFAVWSSATVGSIRLDDYPLPRGQSLSRIKEEAVVAVRQRGYDVLCRKGYTNYAVAVAVARLVDSILRDEKKIYTVSTTPLPGYCIGADVVLGLPCVIGRGGIEQKLLLSRNAEEQLLLEESASKLTSAYQLLPSPATSAELAAGIALERSTQ